MLNGNFPLEQLHNLEDVLSCLQLIRRVSALPAAPLCPPAFHSPADVHESVVLSQGVVVFSLSFSAPISCVLLSNCCREAVAAPVVRLRTSAGFSCNWFSISMPSPRLMSKQRLHLRLYSHDHKTFERDNVKKRKCLKFSHLEILVSLTIP